jgi:hypothetical protein
LAKYLGEGTSQGAANASSLLFVFYCGFYCGFSRPLVRLQLLLANSWQDDKKWQPNFGISAALG